MNRIKPCSGVDGLEFSAENCTASETAKPPTHKIANKIYSQLRMREYWPGWHWLFIDFLAQVINIGWLTTE